MNNGAAFGIGLAVGAIGVTLVYVSLAPSLAERATVEAIIGGAGELSIPAPFVAGISLPLGRRVRRLVASKVAPWTL